jgi:hypothetical protein
MASLFIRNKARANRFSVIALPVLTCALLTLFSVPMAPLSISPAHAGEVQLAWKPGNGPDLAGYKLYYGTSSRDYSVTLDVGNVTTYTISNLDPGPTYYLAAVAYDSRGNESTLSDEVSISLSSEAAEEKTISNWTVSGGKISGAVVSNVYDKSRRSQVVEFKGKGTQGAYRLRNADGNKWQSSTPSVLQWSMSYAERFRMLVELETTAGKRCIAYTAARSDTLGAGNIIYIGLGAGAIPGQWHTFTRDLQADLEKAQPEAKIEEVKGILVRGSLRIDDVKLLDQLPCIDTDTDGLCDEEEVSVYGADPLGADTSTCGISDGYKLDYLGRHWDEDADGDGMSNLWDDDMDNDGFLDGYEIAHGSDPLDSQSVPSPEGP